MRTVIRLNEKLASEKFEAENERKGFWFFERFFFAGKQEENVEDDMARVHVNIKVGKFVEAPCLFQLDFITDETQGEIVLYSFDFYS